MLMSYNGNAVGERIMQALMGQESELMQQDDAQQVRTLQQQQSQWRDRVLYILNRGDREWNLSISGL
jgi:hypothetical protein